MDRWLENHNYKLQGGGSGGSMSAERLSKEIKPLLTLENAKEDYEKLRDYSCKDINRKSNIGNRCMDYYFFKYRLKTDTIKGVDFLTFYKQKTYLTLPSYKRLYKYEVDSGSNHAQAVYKVFQLYYGSVNAFKPIVVRDLLCVYKPKTMLDFSAGWGGRCIGAMSLDVNYIGFDTNSNLKSAYEGVIKTFPHKSDVKIFFRDSAKVDYSKYDYDFVFTSPPYFKKTKPTEAYEGMPEYADRDEFNEKFLFPVVENTYKHMKKGGHYTLNIPIDMYDDIKKVLGGASKKIPLPIQARYADRPPTYNEFIYVWKKA